MSMLLKEKECPPIWFLMYCPKGNEQKIAASCKNNINKDILQDAFILTCSRMRRYQGKWHQEIYPLFPNYVFLESEREDWLSRELEPYRQFTEISEHKEGLLAIKQEEEEFLHTLCGANHHIGMSRGYIKDGTAFVTEGPLAGWEPYIRHIDRHKRVARVEIPMLTGERQIQVGLEIYAKE